NNPEPVQLELSKYTEGWEGAREAVEVLTGKRHTAFDNWTIPAKTAEVFELM
ncbi:MAG: cyclomaltodextrinase C-terminal domain-containing protein, partial [Bacteroidales bacterium]|nr:cyclomaltodextrinase C-terminal domain-containing protein [Bacteroidales bacterium]